MNDPTKAFRALHGEIKDLRRRTSQIVGAAGQIIGLIDGIIDQARKGSAINCDGLAHAIASRNRAVQEIAEALGSTPDDLAGGLLPPIRGRDGEA